MLLYTVRNALSACNTFSWLISAAKVSRKVMLKQCCGNGTAGTVTYRIALAESESECITVPEPDMDPDSTQNGMGTGVGTLKLEPEQQQIITVPHPCFLGGGIA